MGGIGKTMLAVDVRNLRKEFKVQKSREGLLGAFKDLFRREYQRIVAVDNITLQIPQGEICGYIGENGAGKSTTIKMLSGILVPTSGEIRVGGYIPYKEREKFVRNIGVVFGQRSQLWWDIAVIESFRLLRKIYRVPEPDFRKRMDELVERLRLQELLHRPVRKLSLGQRMRCELAAALLHNPSIVFLDEPTIGLDVMVKAEIRQFLQDINRQYGTTIMLTTHDLQDIEALCSRVVILDEGKIIYDGSLERLKQEWGKGKEILFRFSAPCPVAVLKETTAGIDVHWQAEHDWEAKATLAPTETDVSGLIAAVASRAQIADIQVLETNTDEIVREIYQSGAEAAVAMEETVEATVRV